MAALSSAVQSGALDGASLGDSIKLNKKRLQRRHNPDGGDRAPGDYAFDPLGYLTDMTPEQKEDMQLKELKNGRLAMLAFSGVVTQAALGAPTFPYVN